MAIIMRLLNAKLSYNYLYGWLDIGMLQSPGSELHRTAVYGHHQAHFLCRFDYSFDMTTNTRQAEKSGHLLFASSIAAWFAICPAFEAPEPGHYAHIRAAACALHLFLFHEFPPYFLSTFLISSTVAVLPIITDFPSM